MSTHFDVIIIGGRSAGSSLAIRLARQNLKILVLDRASFPSLPAVPSSPITHANTMRLMDELDIPEEAYSHPHAKIEHYIVCIPGQVTAIMPTSLMNIDRNYFYGLDRNKFDTALWSALEKYPNVTARDCFSVTSILKNENGKASGIVGKPVGQNTEERYTADLIVGADGRFSFAAREFGAKTVIERNEHTSASYHAEWEDVEDFSPKHPHTCTVYNTQNGLLTLFIPIETRKYIVAIYMSTANGQFGAQKLESAYLDAIKSIPAAWKRLEKARRVTDVVGVRKIQNGYREAFGDGWALVGDALHYKDPIDGQGIYDALVESKLLAESIAVWRNGAKWSDAGEIYRERVMEETFTMFNETVARVKQQLYSPPPTSLKDRMLTRWMLTDPQFQAHFLRYLSRAIRPDDRGLSNKRVMVRGLIRDLTGMTLF